MSFAWMRRIDTWVGKPLCRVLGWFTRKPKSLYGDHKIPRLPETVVCTKFIGLGSVVLSLPLLRALKESGVRVVFWTFPGQAEIARISGYVDEVLVVRPTVRDFIPTLLKSWLTVRRMRPGAFLDLEPTANFTAILARTTAAPVRVGFMSAKPLRESLFTHLVALTPERHMVENSFWMGRILGISGESSTALPAPKNLPRPESEPFVAKAGRIQIVVNVNSSDLSWHRMWSEKSWIEVCNHLLENPSVELVFPGTASERPRVQTVAGALRHPDRVHNIAGQTSLKQLLTVLRRSQLAVSVDSGIMHLAAWMGVPVVGLFGPETPRLYAPRSSNPATPSYVLWAALPCSPCLSVAADKITRCGDNQCMKLISPDRVLQVCRSALKAAQDLEAA